MQRGLMNRHDRLFASCLCSALLLLLLALAAVPALAQTSAPAVVSRQGYINGTPLAAHTTGAVNSTNASMLVAFVSTHPSWLDLPVSISGLSDNLGNTWNVLVGPTSWTGSSYTLMSAVYYVNAPVTGDPHTITVNLTNPAPLVVHVFAVSGSDTTGPPIYSFITGPGPGPSTDVISQAITVPAATLLLAWAKNENGATANALDGWTLDSASTSFLWAEYQTAFSAGAYDGHFAYSNAIGWQTAIVGVTPVPAAPVNHPPVASNGSAATNQDVPVTGNLVATDVDGNALTFSIVTNGTKGAASITNAATGAFSYTPLPNVNGTDTFTFKANDGLLDSNVATVTVTITPDTTPPPDPTIASGPISPTSQTSATFVFGDSEAGATVLCDLDSSGFSVCTSPQSYPGPLGAGAHVFSVKARD